MRIEVADYEEHMEIKSKVSQAMLNQLDLIYLPSPYRFAACLFMENQQEQIINIYEKIKAIPNSKNSLVCFLSDLVTHYASRGSKQVFSNDILLVDIKADGVLKCDISSAVTAMDDSGDLRLCSAAASADTYAELLTHKGSVTFTNTNYDTVVGAHYMVYETMTGVCSAKQDSTTIAVATSIAQILPPSSTDNPSCQIPGASPTTVDGTAATKFLGYKNPENYKVIIDMQNEKCEMFWPYQDLDSTKNSSVNKNLVFTPPSGGSVSNPSSSGTCNGHPLNKVNAFIRNPNRAVVDLNKMLCYLPQDCVARRLKIDKAKWNSLPADKRLTDQNLYYCVMQYTHQDGTDGTAYSVETLAKNYLLIGNPGYLSLSSAKTITVDYTALTCTVNSEADEYWFDVNTSLCIKQSNPAVAVHLFGNTVTYTNLPAAVAGKIFIPNDGVFLGDSGTSTFKVGSCQRGNTEDPSVWVTGQPHMNFSLKSMKWVYYCFLAGETTHTYIEHDDTTNAYTFRDLESNWICKNDSEPEKSHIMEIDLEQNKCFKGQYEYTYNEDNMQCGSIPVAIHKHDIVAWTGGNLLVDIFSGICKRKNASGDITVVNLIKGFDGGAAGLTGTNVLCEDSSAAETHVYFAPASIPATDVNAFMTNGSLDLASSKCHDTSGAIGTLLKEWGLCVTDAAGIIGVVNSFAQIQSEAATTGVLDIRIVGGQVQVAGSANDGIATSTGPSGYTYLAYYESAYKFLRIDDVAVLGRQHHMVRDTFNLIPSKIKIDIHAGVCYYLGAKLAFVNEDNACSFYNDGLVGGQVRYQIKTGEFELININDKFRETEFDSKRSTQSAFIIDFHNGVCHRYNHAQEYIISHFSPGFTFPNGAQEERADDNIKCLGQKKDGSGYESVSLNGSLVYYLGNPIKDQTGTVTINLEDSECTRSGSAASPFDITTQTCIDYQYSLVYNNAYTLIKTAEFIETNQINAIVDVKNNQCIVKTFTAPCTLSRADSDFDVINTCTCDRNGASVVYEFSSIHDHGNLFQYFGQIWREIKHEVVVKRTHELFDVGEYSELDLTVSVTNCNTSTAITGNSATEIGLCGTVQILPTSYKFDYEAWLADETKTIFLDFTRAQCRFKGECGVYQLKFTPSASALTTVDCIKDGQVTTVTLGASHFQLNKNLVQTSTDKLQWHSNYGFCIVESDTPVITDVLPIEFKNNLCNGGGGLYYILQQNTYDATWKTFDSPEELLGASAIVDLRNSGQCWMMNNAHDEVKSCGYASIQGDLVTCTCTFTSGSNYQTSYSIQNDFLFGTELYIIGYEHQKECEEEDYYKIKYDSDECEYFGQLYTFSSDHLCTTAGGTEVNLRGKNYEYESLPTDKLALIDYHKMQCISALGDIWEFSYSPAADGNPEKKQCSRLTSNGWETFDATSTTWFEEQGEDATTYGLANQTLVVALAQKTCFLDGLTGSQIGTFDEETGICSDGGLPTGYIKYNPPTWEEISDFTTDNSGIELFYVSQAGDDICWTNANTDPSLCTPSIFVDRTQDYPELTFQCTCGTTVLKVHQTTESDKLKIIGGISSRFTNPDFYNSLEIDVENNKCSGGVSPHYNYKEQENACYYRGQKLDVFRQFYEVTNWAGRADGKWLVDYFKQSCYNPEDCTPMKYSHQIDYEGTNFIYCNRIINADKSGFIQRTSDYVEFKASQTYSAEAPEAIDLTTFACQTTTDTLFDSELMSCVNKIDPSLDKPQMRIIQGDHPVMDFYSGVTGNVSNYFKSQLLTTDEKKEVILPQINQCLIKKCTDGDGTTCNSLVVQKGYIDYQINRNGIPQFMCRSTSLDETDASTPYTTVNPKTLIDETTALFVGGRMVISNHCKSYLSIFSDLSETEKENYWIFVEFMSPSSKCLKIYGKPTDWTDWESTPVPDTYLNNFYQVRGIASATHDGSSLDETFNEFSALNVDFNFCGATPLEDFDYRLYHATAGTVIYDWIKMQCHYLDGSTKMIDEILYDQSTDQYYCSSNDSDQFAFGSTPASGKALVNSSDDLTSVIINVEENTCSYLVSDVSTPLFYFDADLLRCGSGLDVSKIPKTYEKSDDSPIQAFVYPAKGRCFYSSSFGHLVTFSYDKSNHAIPNMESVTPGSAQFFKLDISCANSSTPECIDNYAGAVTVSIQCRHYDSEAAVGSQLTIKDFTLEQAMIIGLNDVFADPTHDWTTHNEVWLVKPTGTISSTTMPDFRCIKTTNDEEMADTSTPFGGTVPADTENWLVYDPETHKCGDVEMKDENYKFVIAGSDIFDHYDVVVDQWGKKCYFESGEIHQLFLDQFGLPNHCQDKEQSTQKQYLKYGFKKFDSGKALGSLIPVIFPIYSDEFGQQWDYSTPYEIQPTTFNCKSTGTWLTNFEKAYCWDYDSTPVKLADLCYQTPGTEFHDDLLASIKETHGVQGFIDLCHSKCYVQSDDETDVIWDLFSINEFEVVCQNPVDDTQKVKRLNDQYILFGNRGTYFSTKSQNSFKIKEITCDLYTTGTALPNCNVENFPEYVNGKLIYQDDYGAIIENWYAEFTVSQTKYQFHIKNPDHHFKFKFSNNQVSQFFSPKDHKEGLSAAKEFRHHALFDVVNGQCWYKTHDNVLLQSGPALLSLENQPDLEQIILKIDQFTKSDLDTKIACGDVEFLIKHVYFIPYRNVFEGDCPVGMYEDSLGFCRLCLYGCSTCTQDELCDSCLDGWHTCQNRCYDTKSSAGSAAVELLQVWNNGGTCTACPSELNCKDCSSATKCNKCFNGFVLYEDEDNSITECIPRSVCEVKPGYYAPFDANLSTDSYDDAVECSKCDSDAHCFDCQDEMDACTICQPNYILKGTECVPLADGCGTGRFLLGSSCADCFAGCKNCVGDSSQDCIKKDQNTAICNSGYFLMSETPTDDGRYTCSNNCSKGFYIETDECLPCSYPCEDCEQDADTCNSCLDYNFNQTEIGLDGKIGLGSCVAECPEGTFNFINYASALQTDSIQSNNSDWKPCTQLEWRDFIQSSQFNSIEDLESVNYELDLTDLRPFCMDCHQNCKTCTGPLDTDCVTCISSLYEFLSSTGERTCLSQCPGGYFGVNDPSKKCFACTIDNCSSCSNVDTCDKCNESFYLYNNNSCRTTCPTGFYADALTRSCTACDTSKCSTCVDKADKCTGCSGLTATPFLNEATNECIASCPGGTILQSDICKLCSTQVGAANACPVCQDTNCLRCYGDSNEICTQCKTGFLFIKETGECKVGTQCPQANDAALQKYYGQDISEPTKCSLCPSNCTKCGQMGCEECANGFLLSGFPYKYCIQDTEIGNDCSPGWFEKDGKCEQCSDYCGECIYDRYNCLEEGTTGQCKSNGKLFTPRYPLPDGKLGQLCFCPFEINAQVDATYMKLTMKIPDSTMIDWDYVNSNLSQLLNDRTYKTNEDIAEETLQQFDTILLEEKLSLVSNTFRSQIKHLTQDSTIDQIKALNEPELARLLQTDIQFVPPSTVEGSCIDSQESFGDEQFQVDLIKILFEYQNYSKFGAYTYTTSKEGSNLVITVNLGQDHLFDFLNNSLVIRDNVIKSQDCTWPIKRLYIQEEQPLLLDPSIKLTSNYPDNIVEVCSPLKLTVAHFNFPKNSPMQIEWKITSLRLPNGVQDASTAAEIQELLDQHSLKTQFSLPSSFTNLLKGYTAIFRVRGYSWFTGETADSSLSVTFASSGNQSLQILNSETSFKPFIGKKNSSFSLLLGVSECILSPSETMNEHIANKITWVAELFNFGETETGVGTELVFDPVRKQVVFEDTILTSSTPMEVKVTASDSTPSVNPATYVFTVFPQYQTPIIQTQSDYFQVPQAVEEQTVVTIAFNTITYGDTEPIYSFICKTQTGQSCDFMKDQIQRTVTGTFATDISPQTLKIPTYQLMRGTTYSITIQARISDKVGSATVNINAVKPLEQVLEAQWTTNNIYGKFAQANTEVRFALHPQGLSSTTVDQTYEWTYEQFIQDKWESLSIRGDANFIINGRFLTVTKVPANKRQRIVCTASVNGKTGIFKKEFTSETSINVGMLVTPSKGKTNEKYEFSILNPPTDKIYFYTWTVRTETQSQIITQTYQTRFEEFIPITGTNNKVTLELIVKDLTSQELKLYTISLENEKQQFSTATLGEAILPETQLNVLSGLSSQSEFSPNDIETIITKSSSLYTLFDSSTKEGFSQINTLTAIQLNTLSNNIDKLTQIPIDQVLAPHDALLSSEPRRQAVLKPGSSENFVYLAKAVDEDLFNSQMNQAWQSMNLFRLINNNDETVIANEDYKDKVETLLYLQDSLISQYTAGRLPGQTTVGAQGFKINLNIVDKDSSRVEGSSGNNYGSGGARRMQEEEEEPTLSTQPIDVQINCSHSYILGPNTLPHKDDHKVTATTITSSQVSGYYIIDELTQDPEYEKPICEVFRIQTMKSTMNADGEVEVTIYNLKDLELFERIDICFSTSFPRFDPVNIKYWNQVDKKWEEDELFEQLTRDGEMLPEGEEIVIDDELGEDRFCWRVRATGVYGIFNRVNENPSRLYNGFIIYVIICLDIFLLIGVILGMRLDKQKQNAIQKLRQSSTMVGVNEYIPDEDVHDLAGDLKKEVDTAKVAFEDDDSAKVITRTPTGQISIKQTPSRRLTFCGVFGTYHRCASIFMSPFHLLNRASRVFSLSLQLLFLINVLGIVTHVLDISESYLDAIIAVACAFVVLRVGNIIFNSILLQSQAKKGGCRVCVLVSLALLYCAGHFGPIYVTLLMQESDFLAWTVAFFISFLLDIIVWELIVATWQFMNIKKMRDNKKACCKPLISQALIKAFVK